MINNSYLSSFRGPWTLLKKELLRFWRVAFQTVAAPVITALLYLLIFSHALESHVHVYDGVPYTSFLVPGLIMMSVLQNAFANSSSSLIQSKVMGNLVFVLLTPLTHLQFFIAFLFAAIIRGLVVGLGIYLVAMWFVDIHVTNFWMVFAFALLGSALLGTFGIIAGKLLSKLLKQCRRFCCLFALVILQTAPTYYANDQRSNEQRDECPVIFPPRF